MPQPNLIPLMKSDGLIKHFVIAFLLAAICYFIFFRGIEHRRTKNGPWQVNFTNNAAGMPALLVNQSTLGISNVWITFEGASKPLSNLATEVKSPTISPVGDMAPILTNSSTMATIQRFAQPYPVPFDVPYGKCVFMDSTFLPGTITFELFGHEVELMPRVLIIDLKEYNWQSGSTITVKPIKNPPPTSNKLQ